jgi:DhnA family fructose-bisphosphate aldolase class Ia
MQKIIDSIKNIIASHNGTVESLASAIIASDDIIAILATLCEETSYNVEDNSDDIIEYLETLINDFDDDFSFDFEGAEYRIIAESSIWDIYVEEIKNIVEDCYDLKLDNIPDFVAFKIDWEQTAGNASIDGYGHTFSGYDGSELETKNHYIFRTN